MFWSVTGAAEGSSVVTTEDLKVAVGSTDVEVTGWFLPPGGGIPNGVPGLVIDAFDVDLGDFSDADFVDVVSDPTLTAAANDDGFVPTASADEDVRAYASLDAAVPFTDWTIFTPNPGVTTSARDLSGQHDHSAIAFAFYKTPVRTPLGPLGHYEIGTWVSASVKVDGGGLTGHGPVPPWTPFLRELEAGLLLGQSAQSASREIRGPALELAARQLAHATHLIGQEMLVLAERE